MLKTLIKVRFSAIMNSMFRTERSRGTGMKILFAVLMAYVFIVFFAMFAMLFFGLSIPLFSAGLGWFYFALGGILAFCLSVFGSVFITQHELYEATDNELLLAMPIPPRMILQSRMIALIAVNSFYQALVTLPMLVVWLITQPVNVLQVILFLLCFALLPFFALACSSLLGWLVALISSRMRNKSLISTVLSVAFLVAYFTVYPKIGDYIELLIAQGETIAKTVKNAVFPAYQLGTAISDENLIALLLYLACILIPSAIVWWILTKTFLRIATVQKGAPKVRYKERSVAARTPQTALLGKELRRFFASPAYIMNGGLGALVTLILGVFALIKRTDFMNFYFPFLEAEFTVQNLTPIALSVIACTNMISASAVSLEGKSLWIPKTFPVPTFRILRAKADLHIVIGGIPSLLCGILAIPVFGLQIQNAMQAILLPLIFHTFLAWMGLALNLRFPRFDWINEVYVVKQGMAVAIAMLAGMAAAIVPLIGYMIILTPFLSLTAFCWYLCVLYSVLAGLMIWLVKEWGVKKFESLS